MSTNERVEYVSGDIAHEQLAPSKAARTSFTPGKANSDPREMNWPKDFRIPTGTPAFDSEGAGPVEIQRTRIVKLGRNIISDKTILDAEVLGVRVEARTEPGICGTSVVTDTATAANMSIQERQAGNDNIKGA